MAGPRFQPGDLVEVPVENPAGVCWHRGTFVRYASADEGSMFCHIKFSDQALPIIHGVPHVREVTILDLLADIR